MPAVLYGHGTETRHLSLPGHDLMLALKTPNVLLRLEGLKNGSEIALPKAVQRDPVRGFIEHVDLILVRRGEKVTIEVPIRITGEIAPGDGGCSTSSSCRSRSRPRPRTSRRASTSTSRAWRSGQAVHASDLKLPPGVTLQVDPETLVLHVIARTTEEEPEEEAGEAVPEAPEALAERRLPEIGSSEGEQAG